MAKQIDSFHISTHTSPKCIFLCVFILRFRQILTYYYGMHRAVKDIFENSIKFL